MKIKDLQNIGIVGPGLLGGSIGLALKSREVSARIVGIGHRKVSLDRAVEIGAIDEGTQDLSRLAGCELVILATPISLIKHTIDALGSVLDPGTVVTDVGSTKRTICQWAKSLRRRKIEFVGSHPIAGSEKRGIDFARPDLFVNANCFVTPISGDSERAVGLVAELWTLIGMRVVTVPPAQHDQLLAAVSHLPHIVAAGLVQTCSEDQLKFTGTGFIDTTRIASGDVNLWHDILVSNSDKISTVMKKFIREMEKFRQAVESRDSKKICRFLAEAKRKRDDLMRLKIAREEIDT